MAIQLRRESFRFEHLDRQYLHNQYRELLLKLILQLLILLSFHMQN